MSGKVYAIYSTAVGGKPLIPLEQGVLETGRGLVGDRYYLGTGTLSKRLIGKSGVDITLIESEEIEQFNHTHNLSIGVGELRRNIVTSGVRLNDLIGVTFSVGNTMLEGVRLCEPCAHLSKIATPEVLPGLIGRCGLRAHIITGGTVKPGDVITAT